MLAQEILTFLTDGGAFSKGVRLLEAAGGDVKSFQKALSRPFVLPADRQRLNEALKNVAPRLVETRQHSKPKPAAKKAVQEEPEEVAALRERGKKLLKKRAFLRGQLVAVETDADRYRLAREIMNEVTPAIDRTYDQIRAYEKNGTIPPMPEEKDIMRQAVDMFRRRESLRTIIARKKRELKTLKGAERTTLEVDILENEEEYNQLNEKLGL
jgi:vacuolar-type H+-ATPase catalytic subunit A/Vma1